MKPVDPHWTSEQAVPYCGSEIAGDDRLLRGQGRFSDDLRLDGQLIGVFVGSVHAHARIRMISGPALAARGVVAVLTASISRRQASATSRGRGSRRLRRP